MNLVWLWLRNGWMGSWDYSYSRELSCCHMIHGPSSTEFLCDSHYDLLEYTRVPLCLPSTSLLEIEYSIWNNLIKWNIIQVTHVNNPFNVQIQARVWTIQAEICMYQTRSTDCSISNYSNLLFWILLNYYISRRMFYILLSYNWMLLKQTISCRDKLTHTNRVRSLTFSNR